LHKEQNLCELCEIPLKRGKNKIKKYFFCFIEKFVVVLRQNFYQK